MPEQKILTFADAGSDPMSAMGFREEDPLAAPEPEKTEPPKQETAPAPVVPPPAPVAPQTNPWEQMLAFQNAQRMQQEQAQQQAEYQKQIEAMYTPPPPPANPEELLTDPAKLVAYQQAQAAWAANLQRQNQAWTAQAFQHMQQQMGQYGAQAMAQAVEALRADQTVGSKLQSEGYSNAAEILTEVDRALQSNPQTYLQYRRDPASVEAVARFMISQRGLKPSAPSSGVAGSPNMPYSPSTQSPASGQNPAASNAARRKAEAMLGRKISDKTINERFGRSWEPRFS